MNDGIVTLMADVTYLVFLIKQIWITRCSNEMEVAMSKISARSAQPSRPDSHAIAEYARWLSHKLYAEAICRDPSLIVRAKAAIEAAVDGGGTLGQKLWELLLRKHRDDIIEAMLQDSELGSLLRSNSPFSTLVGVTDRQDRSQIWRQAKSDLLAKTTLIAPFAA
ncbi:hypothetical protein K3M67_14000 [Sphingobium sp. V4]|uniref:hypothetical protein n=1 Tax=Sphingobium sp. V4 TaxID=3038927 RepID=UPI00255809D1|nr:hypothetical protein [Sphingobium sp. V4]WIW88056.1 hypothetical protein K3M67_14000 [Sphingobium sp. V4]